MLLLFFSDQDLKFSKQYNMHSSIKGYKMTDIREANGSCLCGEINISAKSMNTHVGACHCSICRKWGGGPLMAVECGTEVSFSDNELITTFNSSEWAERGFCKQCGSHLFYRLKVNNFHYMPVGIFDDSDDVVFDHQVFIDFKPDYYEFANTTKNLTEAEVFAQHSKHRQLINPELL